LDICPFHGKGGGEGIKETQNVKLPTIRRQIMIVLVFIHILGIIIAVLCSVCEIKSIIYSGPLLSAFSLSIALLAYRRNRTITLYYALATPTVSVFCFAIIFGMKWEPGDARLPIGILLTLFGVINTLLGIAADFELRRPQITRRRKGPFQYSIASIMILTLIVAVSLSLIKTLGGGGIALATLLCYLSICIYILKRFHQNNLPAVAKTAHSALSPRTSDDGG
jgi:hypothetical protein